jgi:hypothetical protein
MQSIPSQWVISKVLKMRWMMLKSNRKTPQYFLRRFPASSILAIRAELLCHFDGVYFLKRSSLVSLVCKEVREFMACRRA